MSIRRYRSLEAMDADVPWARRLDPDNWRRALSLMTLAYRLRPWRFPPGLHKYGSIEDANRGREVWEREASRRERQKA